MLPENMNNLFVFIGAFTLAVLGLLAWVIFARFREILSGRLFMGRR